MTEFAGSEHGGVALQLPEWTDDTARHHPGDHRRNGNRRDSEQSAGFKLGGDACGGNRGGKANTNQPRRAMRGRVAGELRHTIAPGCDFTGLLALKMLNDGVQVRRSATDPVGRLREGCDDDPFIVEDFDRAANGKMVRAHRILELCDQRAGEQDRLNFAGCVCDRTRDRKHPFAIAPIAHGIADCDRLAAEGLLEIVAVADIVARSGGRSDVLAIGTDDGDVGYEAGELRLKS